MDTEQQDPQPATLTIHTHHFTLPSEDGVTLHVPCDRGDPLQIQFTNFETKPQVVRARDDLAAMVQMHSEKGRTYHVNVVRIEGTKRYAVFVTDTPFAPTHWTDGEGKRVGVKEATEWAV